MRLNATRLAPGAILCLGPLLLEQVAAQTGKDRVEQIDPFTHVAYIAAPSDTNTIRLEEIRYMFVPTKILYTYQVPYCESAAAPGPGVYTYCPVTREEGLLPAYELTYSFEGPRSPSTRHWQTHPSFRVYFRAEELTSELRNAVDSDKIDHADAAAHFTVNVSHPSTVKNVVDPAGSTFCDTILIEGRWVQSDTSCVPKILHKTISSPSSHLKITIVPSWANLQPGQVTEAGKPNRD